MPQWRLHIAVLYGNTATIGARGCSSLAVLDDAVRHGANDAIAQQKLHTEHEDVEWSEVVLAHTLASPRAVVIQLQAARTHTHINSDRHENRISKTIACVSGIFSVQTACKQR